jgi:hypothetical protein
VRTEIAQEGREQGHGRAQNHEDADDGDRGRAVQERHAHPDQSEHADDDSQAGRIAAM